jgi:hypothetical protein
MGSIDEENQRIKISRYCPFKLQRRYFKSANKTLKVLHFIALALLTIFTVLAYAKKRS